MKKARETNTDYIKDKKKAEETNDQILALKAKHEEEKARFEKEIRSLQERLNEKDHSEETKDKTMNTTVEHKFAAETTSGGAKTEFSNPISILKMRLNKIISTNKEKKKLVDQYIRNVKLIEDAFEQIKESTGISSIDEIVTTFIKAEEQNYSLFNYVNRLGQETDQLEETNKKIKQDIENFKKSEQMEEMEREKHIQEMQNNIRDMKEHIDRANQEKDEFKDQLKTIQGFVEKMVGLFKKSKFVLAVANKMSYEEGTTFNDTNVIQYLAELEEYISSLITYAAFKKEDPFAAISAIPFEKLNRKDFEKTKLNVDAPTNTQFEQGADGQGVEEEAIVNSSDLFKRFLYLVNNNKISFVSRSTVKQPAGPHITKNEA
jgi:chromosome segregation ATPase